MAYEFKKKTKQKKEIGSSFKDKAMGERVKREEERRNNALDTEFWSCLCFKDESDMNEFVRITGLPDRKFVTGEELRAATEKWKPAKKVRTFMRNARVSSMPPNPLESVDYEACGGSFEKEAYTEAMAIFEALKNVKLQKRYAEPTDSHFWICAVFENRDDAERYLDDMNLRKHGDKYIDASAWLKELA